MKGSLEKYFSGIFHLVVVYQESSFCLFIIPFNLPLAAYLEKWTQGSSGLTKSKRW